MYLEYKVIDNKYTNINQILKQEFKLSAKLMHKVISNKLVLLNSISIDTRTIPNNGDIIKVDLNYEEENDNIVPTKMELDILYYFISTFPLFPISSYSFLSIFSRTGSGHFSLCILYSSCNSNSPLSINFKLACLYCSSSIYFTFFR